MAEYQRKLESAADALARKQLGLEPRKEGVEENDRLPEIYERFKAEYLTVLEDSFEEVCGMVKGQLGIKHLSDDTMLIIANKINDKAISGDLKFVKDLTDDKEIAAVVQNASNIQKEQMEAVRVEEGEANEVVPSVGQVAEAVVVGTVIGSTLKGYYQSLNTATPEQAKVINEQIRVSNYVGNTMDKFYDADGKMQKGKVGAGLAGLWQYVMKVGKDQGLEDVKSIVMARLDGFDDTLYGELKEQCKNVQSLEDLEGLIGHAFYDSRERNAPNANKRESYEELRARIQKLGQNKSPERVEQERQENLKLGQMSDEERKEYFVEKRRELDERARMAKEYKEALDQVLDGNGGYDRLENAVNSIRAFGDNKFYTAVLTRIRENAVSKNDVGLGSMYSTFVEKDKQERDAVTGEKDVAVEDVEVATEATPIRKIDTDEGPEL